RESYFVDGVIVGAGLGIVKKIFRSLLEALEGSKGCPAGTLAQEGSRTRAPSTAGARMPRQARRKTQRMGWPSCAAALLLARHLPGRWRRGGRGWTPASTPEDRSSRSASPPTKEAATRQNLVAHPGFTAPWCAPPRPAPAGRGFLGAPGASRDPSGTRSPPGP